MSKINKTNDSLYNNNIENETEWTSSEPFVRMCQSITVVKIYTARLNGQHIYVQVFISYKSLIIFSYNNFMRLCHA